MGKIVVFGGTSEGRKFAEIFSGCSLEIFLCVVSEYGASLLPEAKNIHVHIGAMNENEMEKFLREYTPDYCLDATHPYAEEASENILTCCSHLKIPCIRITREQEELESMDIYYKDSIEEAVEFLQNTEGNVFLSTGSKNLEKFALLKNYKERCIARVLPTLEVMKKCKELGFEGKNLIGMQGPFIKEMNVLMLRESNAAWLVTKNSGKAGGFLEKCEAAKEVGAKVLVIGRKAEKSKNQMTFSEAVTLIQERYHIKHKRYVYMVGIGVGDTRYMTKQAREILEECDVIIGAKRMLAACNFQGKKPQFESYKKEEIVHFLDAHQEYKKACIVYSGDVGFYSGAKGMTGLLKEYEVHQVTGISSPVFFLNQLNIPWEQVRLISCHGQNGNLLQEIKRHAKVCTLLGKEDDIKNISRELLKFGMDQVKITVGEKLSYPTERVIKGYPKDFLEETIDALSVALFENKDYHKETQRGILDEEFFRGQVPMTKGEVRAIVLRKLQLEKDSIVYDIGAGTGSISIEAAQICTEGKIYAIEQKDEAVELLEKNKHQFQACNMQIVKGEAPDILENLESPTHAFIGGSNGKIKEILKEIQRKNPKIRVVISAIAIETIAEAQKLKEEYPDMEIVQIQISKAQKLGRYHLMKGQNPVYLFSFGGKK